MGEYEYLWNERKDFLLSSVKIGAIATVCVTILTIIALLYNGMDFGPTVLTMLLVMILLFLIITPAVAVGRLVFGNGKVGGGIITNFLHGVWSTVWGILTGGWIGLVIGLFLCMVFAGVFCAVVIGYAIYLPISSIYLYIMYKNEIA